MALTKATYTQAASLQFQDKTISPATLADGTLFQRFDILAFPQKGIKYTGSIGPDLGAPVLTKGTVLHDPGVSVVVSTAGGVSTAEIDTVTINNAPASGTWTLTYATHTTTALARNASAAAVQTALNLLAGVAVTVTGSAGGPYTITWNSVGVRTALTAADTFPHGTFTSGTYFWKITVVDGFGGERASNEITATLTTNDSQPMTWAADPGGVSYNIYRGTTTGVENHLIGNVVGLAFTDIGTAGTVQSPPVADDTGHPVPAPPRTTHGMGS